MPKSVIKFDKNGVKYESSCDKCQYALFELNRRALSDVGRFLCRKFNQLYEANFKKISKMHKKATKYRVFSNAQTKYPRMQIGLTGVKGFYSYFQEFGSRHTKRLGLLQRAAKENVDEIIKIESQYLSGLEDEAKALALIKESEYEGDADE